MRRILSTAAIAAALVLIAAVPAPDGSEYVETTTDVFFHRTDCSGNNDQLYIDLVASTDGGDDCGTIGGVSQVVNEAFIQAQGEGAWVDSFPNEGPLELRLDGSRDLEGVIVFRQYRGIEQNPGMTPGGGKTDIIVEFQGKVDGKFVHLGTATGTSTVTPATPEYEVPFTLDLDDDYRGETLTSLTVDLTVHGVAVNQDFMALSGASKFTVPTLDVVESTS